MSENTPAPAIADATGNEELVEQTVFPPDEFPNPPQNRTDLGRAL